MRRFETYFKKGDNFKHLSPITCSANNQWPDFKTGNDRFKQQIRAGNQCQGRRANCEPGNGLKVLPTLSQYYTSVITKTAQCVKNSHHVKDKEKETEREIKRLPRVTQPE